MIVVRLLIIALMSCFASNAVAACNGKFDIFCDVGKAIEKAVRDTGAAIERMAADGTRSLIPVREFLKASDIPPTDAGAYGLVVFRSKATSANRAKLVMVCKSFIAHFPPNNTIPDTIPLSDRMITIWPIRNPESPKAASDDCDFVIDNYDLFAAESAIADAQLQEAEFDGEGPYLVGWSPSSSRGKSDKLVLIVDMSAQNTQGAIDREFLFWKNEIVQKPELWRQGFSLERVRAAIKEFADQYGPDLLDAIKLVGA